MKTVFTNGEDERTGVEDIALVRTASAVIEIIYIDHKVPHGPFHVFAGPHIPADATLPDCGCNPFQGLMLARSVDDVRRLRDALNLALARAEGGQ